MSVEYNGRLYQMELKKKKLNLSKLSITNITEIKGLENLTNLVELNLSKNKISEITGLDNLKSLEVLILIKNRIVEINGLDNLINLKELHLTDNQISEVNGLENLNKLKLLFLDGNPIFKWATQKFGYKSGCVNGKAAVNYCAKKKEKEIEFEKKIPLIDQYINDKQFSDAAKELNEIVETAKRYNLRGILGRAEKKLNKCNTLDKLYSLFKITEKVKIDDVASIFKMERSYLFEKLIEWSKSFEFRIDGDYLKIQSRDIEGLMNLLDKSYDEWALPIKQKHKKI